MLLNFLACLAFDDTLKVSLLLETYCFPQKFWFAFLCHCLRRNSWKIPVMWVEANVKLSTLLSANLMKNNVPSRCFLVLLLSSCKILNINPCRPMLHFYTFWKCQKTFAFFRVYRNWIFSGGIEIEFFQGVWKLNFELMWVGCKDLFHSIFALPWQSNWSVLIL